MTAITGWPPRNGVSQYLDESDDAGWHSLVGAWPDASAVGTELFAATPGVAEPRAAVWPVVVSSPTVKPSRERSLDEWTRIAAAWADNNQSDPYRLLQQMAEHDWRVCDLAHASGQSEQAVSDYLTQQGAPAGFGGLLTQGRAVNSANPVGVAIQAYLAYPRADARERIDLQAELARPLNRDILSVMPSPPGLPANVLGERMRARYGTELATRLWQLQQASQALRERVWQAQEEAMRSGRFTTLSPPMAWLSPGLPGDFLVPTFDLAAFTAWFNAQQPLVGELNQRQLHAAKAELARPGQAGLQVVDLAAPPDMRNLDCVFYAPSLGYVTRIENLAIAAA
jgi:hypothetical protein